MMTMVGNVLFVSFSFLLSFCLFIMMMMRRMMMMMMMMMV